ncbi:unnamed protein product [Mycena citricolor]|uniref:CCHC-type domain-containing protein n=1 Tax=Mycena citricolor TaxID=2018698 RepID=A0AAD2GU92_9AGAR|nr:unnamed protein product [Mycena citricolor]
MQQTEPPSIPARALRRRNSRGAAMTTGELASLPLATAVERPVTPERTYACVVSPASATLPKPVNASWTIGGDIASTPFTGERPARENTENSPRSPLSTLARGQTDHLDVAGSIEEADRSDGPWTLATKRTARTHRESASSRSSSPASRTGTELNDTRNSREELTSILDEAAEAMSPEMLRLISDRYASLASAAEQRAPVPRQEQDLGTTSEDIAKSDVIGDKSKGDHAYWLKEAEWSDGSVDPQPPVAGPSQEKGKGPDPGNWGEAQLSDSDLEAQNNALKAFELAQGERVCHDSGRTPPGIEAETRNHALRMPNKVTTQASDRDVLLRELSRMRERLGELEERERQRETSAMSGSQRPKLMSERARTRAPSGTPKRRSTEPKENIGFVNSVLRGVSLQPSESGGSSSESSSEESEGDDSGGLPSESSSDSSSDTGSSPSSSSTESDSSDDSSMAVESRARKSKTKKRKRKASPGPKGKMLVKPNPPARYDGSENADQYTQFVDEANRYCELGNVPKAHHVPIIGSFLDGDAKDFYNRRIRGQEHKWTLKKMLRRLLKYCFSLDYRQKQRKRLTRCHQNGKSVNKHVLELESIMLQIGLKKDHKRVALLWNSFDADIQEELFRFGLDPEKSKWARVVKKAIRAERFLSLDRRRKSKSVPSNNAAGSGPGPASGGQDVKKKKFFPRRQRGVIKASAAAVMPPRENGPKPVSRHYPPPATAPSPSHTSTRSSDNTADRPWERRLSPQKRAELMTRGVCLNCEEAGHMARSCPKLTTMKSKVKGKPPGFGAHGVSLRLASLGETTEVFETLDVASAFPLVVRDAGEILEQFSESESSKSEPSNWEDISCADIDELEYLARGMDRPTCSEMEMLAEGMEALSLGPEEHRARPALGLMDQTIESMSVGTESPGAGTGTGDLVARFACLVLQRCAPFPGDDGSEPTEDCFLVYRVHNADYYCILDCGTPLNILEGDEIVHADCLEDPEFQLGWHWAQKCYLAQGIHPDAPGLVLPERYFRTLGNSTLAMTLILLQQYEMESFRGNPNDGDVPLWEGQEISAGSLLFRRASSSAGLCIQKSLLRSENFDLRQWYEIHLSPTSITRNDSGTLDDDPPQLEQSSDSEEEEGESEDESVEASWRTWVEATHEAGLLPELSLKSQGVPEGPGTSAPEAQSQSVRSRQGQGSPVRRPRDHCSRKLGDLMAEGAQSLLEFGQPYPGDTLLDKDAPGWIDQRFSLQSSWGGSGYLIRDQANGLWTYLPQHLLESRDFELAAWYADRVVERLDIPIERASLAHQIAVDDLLGIQLGFYLEDMVKGDPVNCGSYTNIEPRFATENPGKSDVPCEYVFEEEQEEGRLARISVPREQLLNADLDLINLRVVGIARATK